jgi:hypothetical protein
MQEVHWQLYVHRVVDVHGTFISWILIYSVKFGQAPAAAVDTDSTSGVGAAAVGSAAVGATVTAAEAALTNRLLSEMRRQLSTDLLLIVQSRQLQTQGSSNRSDAKGRGEDSCSVQLCCIAHTSGAGSSSMRRFFCVAMTALKNNTTAHGHAKLMQARSFGSQRTSPVLTGAALGNAEAYKQFGLRCL